MREIMASIMWIISEEFEATLIGKGFELLPGRCLPLGKPDRARLALYSTAKAKKIYSYHFLVAYHVLEEERD